MGAGIFGEMAFSFPRLYLAGGVTTIRTTGALEPYTDLELKKQIDKGETPGPKIHVTGPYLEGAGSFAVQMHELSGPDDATKTVNFWLDQGVDNFKAYMCPQARGESYRASLLYRFPGGCCHWHRRPGTRFARGHGILSVEEAGRVSREPRL
jgi:hypothetical protein